MKSLAKVIAVLLLMLLFFVLFGCGDTASPDGATITVKPDFSQTGVASVDVPHDYTVVVRYADGTPIPNARVNIAGHYATNISFVGPYGFYLYADATSPSNIPVNSPFDIVTDDNGSYTFSVLITAFSGTFKDTIAARSGTALGSASLQVN